MKSAKAKTEIVNLNLQLEVPAGKAELIQTLLENYLQNELLQENLRDYQSTWQISVGDGNELVEWQVLDYHVITAEASETLFNLFPERDHIFFRFKKDGGGIVTAAIEITEDTLWFFVEPFKETVGKLDLTYVLDLEEDSQGFVGVPHILVMDTVQEECVSFAALTEIGTRVYFECGVKDLGTIKGAEREYPTPEGHTFGYDQTQEPGK